MSQNDPKWGGGRRNGDGPPDLDEILRGLSQKLARLFGKKGGRPGPYDSVRSPRNFKGGAGVILVIIVVLWMASGFYVVDEREHAVVTRFGRYIETVDKSGLHWHLPTPIEQRELVNVTEVRSLEVGIASSNGTNEEGTMLTGDQNIIQMQLEIQYNIKSARDFLYNNRLNSIDGRDIVKQTAETAIREVVGRNKVDYVLNEGRGKIAEDTQALMQALLNKYGSGISITRVNISDVQPPEPVQAAFADAVKARQDRARLVNEGRAYANDVIPKASGMAARLEEESQGYRQQVVSRAQGDTERFKQVLSEYTKAPQVTRQRLYLETMQQVYTNSTKVVVDQKAGNNLLYLPLDKLLQMRTPQQTASSITAKPAPSVNIAEPVEAVRGRSSIDREGR
jgi:membrane protease subunit HflK